jgi:hypothetical protein
VRPCSARLLAVGACVALAGCGGEKGPPRHPVGEMTARSTAKQGLIDLVVSDPGKAERLQAVYLELAALGRDFDRARARAMLRSRDEWERRSAAEAQATPASAEALELFLAPPIAEGKAAYERYTTLMLEARSLLRPDEFETLNRVR